MKVKTVELPQNECHPCGVTIPVIYKGNRYIVTVRPKTTIIDVDNENTRAFEIDTGIAGESRYLGHIYNGTILKVKFAYIKYQKIIIALDKIDFSSQSCERKILREISHGAVTEWGNIAHGTSIPPSLLILVDWKNYKIHYVETETGAIRTVDAGGSGHEAEVRASHKFIPKTDDIEMLFGKHLSGSALEKWKVFSNKRETLVSTGGGSPRPCMGGMAVFSDTILMLGGSGGVVGADNDFVVLDSNFNVIKRIDVSGIVGHTAGMLHGHILFKKTDGGYYGIIGADNDASSYCTKFTACFVEFDKDFNVVNKTQIVQVSTQFETKTNIYPGYSDITSSPILDIPRRMIYLIIVDGRQKKLWLTKVDISDIWGNIEEINQRMWVIDSRVGTTLNITAVPL